MSFWDIIDEVPATDPEGYLQRTRILEGLFTKICSRTPLPGGELSFGEWGLERPTGFFNGWTRLWVASDPGPRDWRNRGLVFQQQGHHLGVVASELDYGTIRIKHDKAKHVVFRLPDDWEVIEKRQGEVVLKPPERCCVGCVNQWVCDANRPL